MRVTVVLAHPDPQSFNHALAGAIIARLSAIGHDVILHDLYAERFDPILPASEIPMEASLPPTVDAHCREIAAADGIIIVHPNWWGQPPAILKGWIDRVMRPGVAYRFVEDRGWHRRSLKGVERFIAARGPASNSDEWRFTR